MERSTDTMQEKAKRAREREKEREKTERGSRAEQGATQWETLSGAEAKPLTPLCLGQKNK